MPFTQLDYRKSQAYQFLSCVLPWPPDGKDNYMSLHWSYTGKDKKTAWWGGVYKNLDEMTRAAINKAHEPNIQGVYVCMASQRTALPKVTRQGNNILVPSRIAANAAEHRSFYIDVDVKQGGYATTTDALNAGAAFVKAVGLPRPNAVVATGSGGFHLHWTLGQPIGTEVFRTYAQALANAIKQHGLMADAQCTVDAVRILRVPDTFNKKSGQPKSVELLGPIQPVGYPNDVIFAALEPYVDRGSRLQPAMLGGSSPIPFAPLDNALSAGVQREARPVFADNVAKECAFVRDALATGGKDYNEPQWNYTTLLAAFMEDGRAQAHKMASGHPEYTVESTDAKFTRKEHDKINSGVGWPMCRTIATVCTACQTCPHRDEGKSPLHWGHYPSAVDKQFVNGTDEHLPHGYVQDTEHRIFRTKLTEDGDTEYFPLTKYAIKDAWLQQDPWVLCFSAKIANTWRPVQLPLAAAERKAIAACLAGYGFGVTADQTKTLGDFFVAWIQRLQETKDKVLPAVAFGWQVEKGDISGFTYAGKIFSPNGERPAAVADRILAEQYTPHGVMAPWIAAVKLITDQKRPELDCILAASFAGPLMRFTGQQGALMSAYSIESGVGKTTAMKVAAAVWGSPIKTIQALDDTHASVVHKIGEIRSLPLFWDEIKTDEDVARFVKLAFQVTGGKERSRMTQNIQQRDVGTWETLVLVASNDTLIDEVIKATKSTAAGIYRLLEFVVPANPVVSKTNFVAVGRSIQLLNDNYGHAGEIYAKYLGENHAKIPAMMDSIADDLTAACHGKQEERFWFVCAASILVGAFIANGLNLTAIDFHNLRTFLIKTILEMRISRDRHSTDIASSRNIEELLSTYMNIKRSRHTLWTNCMIPNRPGRPRPISKNVDFVPLKPTDTDRLEALEIHIAKKDGVMRLAVAPLREWIGKSYSLKPTSVTAYLIKEYNAQELSGVVLGGGTEFATGGMRCLEINFAGTRLSSFIDNLASPKDEL